MSTTEPHPVAADYLKRLDRAASGLASGPRQELLRNIEEHLSQALVPGMSDADALTVLEQLGTPEEIVAAEIPEATVRPQTAGMRDWAAIVLLLLGGFALGVGWLLGLILLWGSRTWATKDKLIATLILPGGLAGSLVVFALAGGRGTPSSSSPRCTPIPHSVFMHCSEIMHKGTALTPVQMFVLIVVCASPLATAVRLAWVASRTRAP
jgi:hypothetical protein